MEFYRVEANSFCCNAFCECFRLHFNHVSSVILISCALLRIFISCPINYACVVCDVLRSKFLWCCCILVAESNALTQKIKSFSIICRRNSGSTTQRLQLNLEIDLYCTLLTNVATFCSLTVFRNTRFFAMVMLAYVPVNLSETSKFSWMNILLIWTHFSTWYLSQCERNLSCGSKVT